MAAKPRWPGLSTYRNYKVEEAARALGVCKESIRRWVKRGLPAITDKRPTLIRGADLIAYLIARKAPKTQCGPHQCYCVKCRQPRAPMISTGAITINGKGRPFLRGVCGDCGTRMTKPIKRTLVSEVAAILDESLRVAG